MIIDGRAIAEEIKATLKERVRALGESDKPTLFIVKVGADFATEGFIAVKKKFAKDIGIPIEEVFFSEESATTALLEGKIAEIVKSGHVGGIVVQLPLPHLVDTQAVLNMIPPSLDADVLSEESARLFEEGKLNILPPVVGAIREILLRASVFLRDKKVAVLGKGRLVGAPAEVWFQRFGAKVTVFDISLPPRQGELLGADIIVSGIGKPGFITPEMVKNGAILLDAGTSEAGGKIVGDARTEVAEKCALFTPVPGGIGPITVAMLFQNLFTLTKENSTQ